MQAHHFLSIVSVAIYFYLVSQFIIFVCNAKNPAPAPPKKPTPKKKSTKYEEPIIPGDYQTVSLTHWYDATDDCPMPLVPFRQSAFETAAHSTTKTHVAVKCVQTLFFNPTARGPFQATVSVPKDSNSNPKHKKEVEALIKPLPSIVYNPVTRTALRKFNIVPKGWSLPGRKKPFEPWKLEVNYQTVCHSVPTCTGIKGYAPYKYQPLTEFNFLDTASGLTFLWTKKDEKSADIECVQNGFRPLYDDSYEVILKTDVGFYVATLQRLTEFQTRETDAVSRWQEKEKSRRFCMHIRTMAMERRRLDVADEIEEDEALNAAHYEANESFIFEQHWIVYAMTFLVTFIAALTSYYCLST